MKIELNDPQLTAYALGELHGQEAEEMKNRIDKDPEARKYVEDIQATAKLLSEELSKEPTDSLAPESRSKLLRAEPKKWFRQPQWVAGLSALATAGLALVVGLKLYQPAPVAESVQQLQVAQPVAVENKPEATADKIDDGYVFEDVQKKVVAANEATVDADAVVEESAPAPDMAPPVPAESGFHDVGTQGRGTGLLSAFGGGGVRKQLGQSYSGSGAVYEKPAGLSAVGRVGGYNTESYATFEENGILKAKETPLSTFSIDVDTASYSNVRRMLIASQLPSQDAVRIEEMVNYFSYDYAPPTDGKPFSTHVEIAKNPWNKKSRLVRIALKGQEIPDSQRPASNLVFLVDVSGSMMDANKLPLVKKSLELLVNKMRSRDKVAIVVYAGSSGLVLDSTDGEHKEKIRKAIENMTAGGSTNGEAGIELAYSVASKNFVKDGINRVILATDGDFNVGATSEGDLIRLIETKAKTGVFLSVLGFGMGNLKDSNMQKLSDKGNGNYAYIDSLREARKALVEQAGGTLQTIAKDVKIQVEFNPKLVAEYRLIGYEKRRLNAEDFNDDTKDAGEIGSGHTVTAFYEVFTTKGNGTGSVDPLKYQAKPETKDSNSNELLTVKLRYKAPEGDKSQLIEVPVANSDKSFEDASGDFKFAASVVEFAQILKDSKYKGTGKLDHVLETASANKNFKGKEDSYRKEFVELVKKARSLKK